jgi:hypothetical protein
LGSELHHSNKTIADSISISELLGIMPSLYSLIIGIMMSEINKNIRDMAIKDGIYDCITDPYDKLNNGDPYSSVMIDLERFAIKIVEECIEQCWTVSELESKGVVISECSKRIRKHFGIM